MIIYIHKYLLKIKDKSFLNLSDDMQKSKIKEINTILKKENVAYDINSYRTAPPGFRIWEDLLWKLQILKTYYLG